jgi:Dolichyl-phosphate-mannose-protein mannosyltransferase
MFTEQKKKSIISIGLAVLLMVQGFLLQAAQSEVGLMVRIIGGILWIWGIANYAEAKGYSIFFGAFLSLTLIGVVVLPVLPELTEKKVSKTPWHRDVFLAGAVIGAVFVTLTIKSWRKWPDLIVDFGAQLYTPWQLSTGAVLYRDVHYLVGGPLSQYYHALLFKIFGVSFLAIIISNLAVLALMMAIIYLYIYRCSDQLTALTASVAVLVAFAFAQYTTVGIFNYITPYSAEVVHGLALSILTIALLARWFETENPKLAGAAGFCAGLVLLTKPDMFLALAVMMLAGAVLSLRAKRKTMPLCRSLLVVGFAGLIPAAAFFLYFLCVENFSQSVQSVFAAWIPLLTTSVAHNQFYRWCMGLDAPWDHLRQTALQFLSLTAVATVCALVSLRKIPLLLTVLLFVLCAFELIQLSWNFNWFNCGHCLPLLGLTLLALLVGSGVKNGWETPVVFATLWTVWSLALLAKLGFFCRIWHYGFALAMPAFVSGIYLLLWALPRQLERCGVRPIFFRSLMWLMLLPGLTRLTQASLKLYSDKTLSIGSGADTIVAFNPHFHPVDSQVATALHWVETNVPPGATLAVLPQGALLNYLSRHNNPCGYVAWNPPEIAAFGQEKMTAALIAHSPDYVIELFVNYGEYGENYFGLEKRFGLDAQRWIDAHYQLVDQIGHDWLKDGQFGIKILKKNRF